MRSAVKDRAKTYRSAPSLEFGIMRAFLIGQLFLLL
jgi:hypothetical protein